MNKYTFYWDNGKREVLEGFSVIDALLSSGYTTSIIHRISFYLPGVNEDFSWNKETKSWDVSCEFKQSGRVNKRHSELNGRSREK